MGSRGFSLLEVLAAISILVIVAGAAVPLAHNSVERSRAAAAASYVSGRAAKARFEAVKRSAFVAIRFVENADGYWFRTYVDGNGNGVLARDINSGVDRPITSAEQLDHHFPGVTFGIESNVPSLDSPQILNTRDPIQIGNSTLLSFNPNGCSSSGTLFIRGQRASQFAVRVLGATGRTRVFQFSFDDRTWRRR
ncbi:MAG TPA: prepilin-type N-terminal cleavage/methylation domain-containing protein [Vicinamibacterales bacterium]|nr:prepilin-type N-terminal cleavage/methylation domain-containing protein [Vicinamibacterales bacterium]